MIPRIYCSMLVQLYAWFSRALPSSPLIFHISKPRRRSCYWSFHFKSNSSFTKFSPAGHISHQNESNATTAPSLKRIQRYNFTSPPLLCSWPESSFSLQRKPRLSILLSFIQHFTFSSFVSQPFLVDDEGLSSIHLDLRIPTLLTIVAYQYHYPNMTYHPQPPADEMEWLKHQLWERDFRINSLEARLQDKNITIARMEERLDHARKDAEGALRTVMLVCSASERMLWTPPDSVNDEKRLKQMERDVQHSPFIVKEEKYRRLGEVQNVAETSTSTTPLTPDSTPLDDKISFNDKESRRPTVYVIPPKSLPVRTQVQFWLRLDSLENVQGIYLLPLTRYTGLQSTGH